MDVLVRCSQSAVVSALNFVWDTIVHELGRKLLSQGAMATSSSGSSQWRGQPRLTLRMRVVRGGSAADAATMSHILTLPF